MSIQQASSTAILDKPGQVAALKLRHVWKHPKTNKEPLLNPKFPCKVHKAPTAIPVPRAHGQSRTQLTLAARLATVLPAYNAPTPASAMMSTALAPHKHTGQETADGPENHNRKALSKNASSSHQVQSHILPISQIWLLHSWLWERIKMSTGLMETAAKCISFSSSQELK